MNTMKIEQPNAKVTTAKRVQNYILSEEPTEIEIFTR